MECWIFYSLIFFFLPNPRGHLYLQLGVKQEIFHANTFLKLPTAMELKRRGAKWLTCFWAAISQKNCARGWPCCLHLQLHLTSSSSFHVTSVLSHIFLPCVSLRYANRLGLLLSIVFSSSTSSLNKSFATCIVPLHFLLAALTTSRGQLPWKKVGVK